MSGNNGTSRTIVILGGGPASSAFATLAARDGARVAILHRPKGTPLLVGESLVPAIVNILRKLGVEEEVRAFAKFKPGAIFDMNEFGSFPFTFKDFCGDQPSYAYNVPRIQFEACLMENAKRAGVKVYETEAKVERVPGTDKVQLSQDTLNALKDFITSQPDLIVDATGRARVLPRLLEIPAREGGRKDTALFAHLDRTQCYKDGYVHSSRLDHGWSWRIPLPGRMSLGIVIPSEHPPKHGNTPEERYDNLLKHDSYLRVVTAGAKRLTPVLEFTNYQLVSTRLFGDNWVLLGDTAGFIDPVFSSGLLIGLTSAMELAEALRAGSRTALEKYERSVIHHLKTWHEIVGYYYDGRMFTSFRVGQMLKDNPIMRMMFPHVNKHMGRIFMGSAAKAAYSMNLMRGLMKYGLRGEDPKKMMIR
jgi:flavin-dependent dehydrogenase